MIGDWWLWPVVSSTVLSMVLSMVGCLSKCVWSRLFAMVASSVLTINTGRGDHPDVGAH